MGRQAEKKVFLRRFVAGRAFFASAVQWVWSCLQALNQTCGSLYQRALHSTLAVQKLAVKGTKQGTAHRVAHPPVGSLVRRCAYLIMFALRSTLVAASASGQQGAQATPKPSRRRLVQGVSEQRHGLPAVGAWLIRTYDSEKVLDLWIAPCSAPNNFCRGVR
jgi:hypothetical protein